MSDFALLQRPTQLGAFVSADDDVIEVPSNKVLLLNVRQRLGGFGAGGGGLSWSCGRENTDPEGTKHAKSGKSGSGVKLSRQDKLQRKSKQVKAHPDSKQIQSTVMQSGVQKLWSTWVRQNSYLDLFQACADIKGSESSVEEVQCVAQWKEGSTFFFLGLLNHSHVLPSDYEGRFR